MRAWTAWPELDNGHPSGWSRGDGAMPCGIPPRMRDTPTFPGAAAALVGWRLFALVYDLFPVLALWMLARPASPLVYPRAATTMHDNIPPFSRCNGCCGARAG